MRIDIGNLKHHIHVLGRALGMRDTWASAEDLANFQTRYPNLTWKDHKTGLVSWNYAAVLKRYIQLVAFRSQLRGKLHFSPKSNLEEAYGCLGVPCRVAIGDYVPITLAVQAEWVAPLFEEFACSAASAEARTETSTPPAESRINPAKSA